jgi:hypothetical protein
MKRQRERERKSELRMEKSINTIIKREKGLERRVRKER